MAKSNPDPKKPVKRPKRPKRKQKKKMSPEEKAQRKAQRTDLAKASPNKLPGDSRNYNHPDAQRLAQIVNLHIAGYSLEEIGSSTGHTAAEIDRMIQTDAARYIRSQPQLRVYVRNWASDRYTTLLASVWDKAKDPEHPDQLPSQDRALKIIDKMVTLHGANAPQQQEIKVEAAPEAVDQMVARLAAQQGLGYDTSIFDVVDAEVVHEAQESAHRVLEQSSQDIDSPEDPEDVYVNPSEETTDGD